jgi:hypothetical protein
MLRGQRQFRVHSQTYMLLHGMGELLQVKGMRYLRIRRYWFPALIHAIESRLWTPGLFLWSHRRVVKEGLSVLSCILEHTGLGQTMIPKQ